MAPWSSGQDASLSRWNQGFDSPWSHLGTAFGFFDLKAFFIPSGSFSVLSYGIKTIQGMRTAVSLFQKEPCRSRQGSYILLFTFQ